MTDIKWLDEKIYWLSAMLGVNNDLFLKNFNSTSEYYTYFTSSKTEDIKQFIDIISKDLGFIPPITQYDWEGVLLDDEKLRGIMSSGQIIISMNNVGDKYSLSATTIHELMHYYLMNRKNIVLPDNIENEKITDLAAIVLGFGKFILNSKAIPVNVAHNVSLGLLTPEETAHAYTKISAMRNVKNLSFISLNGLGLLNQYEKSLKKNYKDTRVQSKENEPGILSKLIAAPLDLFLKIMDTIIRTPIKLFKRKKLKMCPYCRKKIDKDLTVCSKCNRLLIEHVSK